MCLSPLRLEESTVAIVNPSAEGVVIVSENAKNRENSVIGVSLIALGVLSKIYAPVGKNGVWIKWMIWMLIIQALNFSLRMIFSIFFE